MPTYAYTATTARGATRTGEIEAVTAEAAREMLRLRGWKAEQLTPEAARPQLRRLSTDDATQLAGFLAEVTRGGLPLASGLRALADDLPHSRLAPALRRLAHELEAGRSLDEAIDALGPAMPEHLRALILSSLASGEMGATLDGFVDQQRRLSQLWQDVWQALAYPLLILALAATILMALAVTVLPAIGEIFGKDDWLTLRAPQAYHLTVWLVEEGLPWLGACALGLVLLLVGARVFGGKAALHRLRAAAPLVGPAFVCCGLSEMATTLAALLARRMPLPDALRCTGAGLSDRYFGRACGKLADAVARGEAFPTALANSPVCPSLLLTLARWGAEHDQLAPALALAGQAYEERAGVQATLLRNMVPPVVFLAIALLVAFVATSIIGPFLQLIRTLSTFSGSTGIMPEPSLALANGALNLLLLGLTLQVVLRWIYGPRGAATGDRIYFVLRLASRLMLVYALVAVWLLSSEIAILAAAMVPIALLVVATVWADVRAARRRALLSLLTASMERGVPLPPVLQGFAEEQYGWSRRRTQRFADLVGQGLSLAEALRRYPDALPAAALPHTLAAGAVADLPAALREAAQAELADHRLWRKIASRLTYGVFVLIVIQVVLLYCLIKLVPAFENIFDDFELTLPSTSQLFFDSVKYQPAPLALLTVLTVLFGLGSLVIWLLRSAGWLRSTPADALLRSRHTARVLRSLGLVAEHRQPLGPALEALSESYPARSFARRLRRAAEDVEQGGDWCESLLARRVIGHSEAAVLAAAQRVDNLPWALREMGGHAARRSAYRIQALMDVVFPLVVLLVGAYVALFAVAFFVPLVKLIASLT